ncbi:MAG TPA: response regulator [Acidimicrobiales bacterium]|nr:response regulator [Acidimicrobiales bacterium]
MVLNEETSLAVALPSTADLHPRPPIRVVVADPSPEARRTLRQHLEASDRFSVIEAGSGPEALAALSDLHPDWVLVDLDADDSEGLRSLPWLAASASPATRVVGFWNHLINLTSATAATFGAQAVFSKAAAMETVSSLLESAA